MWGWSGLWRFAESFSRNGIFNSNRWQGMGMTNSPPNYREHAQQLKNTNRKKAKAAQKSKRRNRRK